MDLKACCTESPQNPASPDAAWCTDITYIWTNDDGFVYLTSVMDLLSRKIISWVLTKDMTAESVPDAIKIAQKRRNIEKQVIIHSDRGIQFTGELYKEITKNNETKLFKKSMSIGQCMHRIVSFINKKGVAKSE